MKAFRTLMALGVLSATTTTTTHAAIAPSSSSSSSSSTISSLSNSWSQVIAGLAAKGCDEVTTACLLTSRSMTATERQLVSQQLVGSSGDDSDEVGNTNNVSMVMGNAQRALAVAQPSSIQQVASAIVASAGNVIYCPSAIDLARGEGLLESLGPAMEVLLKQRRQGDATAATTLWVVAEDPVSAKRQLQASVEAFLTRWSATLGPSSTSTPPLTTLEDVFATVQYVTPAEALETLTSVRSSATQAASQIAIASKTSSATAAAASSRKTTVLSGADLAAARILGPISRRVAADAVAVVHAQCREDDGQRPVRVVDFGPLVEAALSSARQELQSAATTAMPAKNSNAASAVVASLQQAMQAQLEFTLQADFEEQLELLTEEAYQGFRKSLSKLIIGPNLAQDMQQVVATSLAAYAKQCRRLVAPSCRGAWSTAAAQAAFATRLRDTITQRLQTARASGKFRPLPRKGVTVGLHWLLPKPFGNDYRQEPWLVHASDNLVYVPPDKMTEVSPEAVAAGDWRNQVVPSPVGNDMIFMQ